MLLRKLDFLSPPITLYFKGENSHSSIFAGILTIIVYSICCAFMVLYAIQFIKKTNPQVCYYNRYVEDAGEFPVNSSSIFNFIQILDTAKNIPDPIDFDILTIIGIEQTVDIYQDNNDLTKYNHWLYGNCNNSTDTIGINDLIKFEHFTESACIRKYYNKNENKYYQTNEKGFKWPTILHGCSHPNRTFYGIIVEKCRNTSLKLSSDGKYCKSKEDIINYIKSRSINFQLIDQFTDILNYTTPYRKYFYSISNGLFEESYTTNHLNLNPTKLISDEGYFWESKKEILSYYFDLNEKVTSSQGDSGLYVAFYFWMQNRMQYYERVYEKVQDVLSDVGGLCSIFLTIAECINFLVNRYINLFDTQNYMNEIENSKIYEKNIFKFNSKNSLVRINVRQNFDKLFPPKNSIFQANENNNDSSNKVRLFKEEVDIYNKSKKKIKIIKRKKNSTKNLKGISLNNICLNNNNEKKTLTSLSLKKNINENDKEKNESQNKDKIINNGNKDIYNKKNNNTLKLRHYLAYLISLTKCYSNIKLLSDFRIKMISEENIILNNLNIDKIFNKYKSENTNINQDLEIIPKPVYKN